MPVRTPLEHAPLRGGGGRVALPTSHVCNRSCTRDYITGRTAGWLCRTWSGSGNDAVGTRPFILPSRSGDQRQAGRTATGVVEEYGYDAGGGRVWRAHEGVVTLYFGLVEVDVAPNTTNAVATRAFYRFGGVVAQRERKGSTDTVAYLHGDHLGSVGVVTGANGSLVSRTTYGPWGQVRTSTGAKPTTIDYTGQLRDGTGLLYMGARYYDPVLGRFGVAPVKWLFRGVGEGVWHLT